MVGWRITEGEVGGRGVRWMRDREGGRIEGFRYTRDGNRGNLESGEGEKGQGGRKRR